MSSDTVSLAVQLRCVHFYSAIWSELQKCLAKIQKCEWLIHTCTWWCVGHDVNVHLVGHQFDALVIVLRCLQ